MNGNKFLFDTNTLIAFLKGNDNLNKIVFNANWIGVSVISVTEFLCFKDLSMDDVDLLNEFTKQVEILDFTFKNFGLLFEVSQIRIAYKLKLPDAIIAATAIENNAILITADKDFEKIKNLRVLGY
jgi:predicted nucleic acid-binding protein